MQRPGDVRRHLQGHLCLADASSALGAGATLRQGHVKVKPSDREEQRPSLIPNEAKDACVELRRPFLRRLAQWSVGTIKEAEPREGRGRRSRLMFQWKRLF